MASGYIARLDTDNGGRRNASTARQEAALEHQALFALVYQDDQLLGRLSYNGLANVVAHAELFGVLSVVAPLLRKYIVKRPGVWEDVRFFVNFHLALAIKLQCSELCYEGLKHYIGSSAGIPGLQSFFGFKIEVAFSHMKKREIPRTDMDRLAGKPSITGARNPRVSGGQPAEALHAHHV